MSDKPSMDTFVSLCKRRGFIFQSSEIYGGIGGFWDYGPLGVEMKNSIKQNWWRAMVQHRDDVVGLDASIIMNPRVWVASGHVETFADPMVDCKDCKRRFRTDDLTPNDNGELRCPECGGELTDSRMFNLMFKTYVGPVADEASVVYLRPETAQAMFVNFDNVLTTTRRKLPFGIAQIGRSFRNEITPGNFIFRDREFEQMEMEYFVMPGTDEDWHDRWIEERFNWWLGLGVRKENLQIREHTKEELSHYSKRTVDIEYDFPFAGFAEIEGIANRTNFDLKQHEQHAGRTLQYFDEPSGEHVVPFVIEPAMGVDRCFLTVLIDAYAEEEVKGEKRVVLRLKPELAPVKVAVLPLSRNEQLAPTARKVWDLLRPHFMTQFDDAQSIGRRYRRQDEIGTPYCVTVDFDTLEDEAVTIRDRDEMTQDRVPMANLVSALRDKLGGC
ncbi:MAG TPA: glycine--tRNA ligase [Dehalococcoidia bacterium]|nr:glycine--tRNA ligase [Dehalococcoidia bacterium]